MGRPKKTQSIEPLTIPKRRPSLTPEAEQAHMISLAINCAEEQMLNGTASSQVITHYLKLAANREKESLELEKLREENKLLRAKTEAIESAKDVKELYENAIKAMQLYQGRSND